MYDLGKGYLRLRPEEGSVDLLLPLLLSEGDGSFAVRLRRSILRDWQAHDVVTLDGWISARTEARLCAFSFLDGSAA